MALQQPLAVDLRVLTSILNLAGDIERIGDHAKGIARITLKLSREELVNPPAELALMADKAVSVLDRSLQAFVERDAEAARLICDDDDEVDALQDQTHQRLVAEMIEQPSTIGRAVRLMLVAHHLERTADRATNICERVVFVSSGRMEELNVSVY